MKLGEVIIQVGSGLSIDGVRSKILIDKIVTIDLGEVLTQSKGIVAGIRGDIFSCVFFFCLHKRVKTCLINNSINKI